MRSVRLRIFDKKLLNYTKKKLKIQDIKDKKPFKISRFLHQPTAFMDGK